VKPDQRGVVVQHKSRLIAAHQNWPIHHIDVKSAFLNGDLNREVYSPNC
jgi:hypothetical protein